MLKKRANLADLKKIRISDPFWSRYTSLVTGQIIPYQWKILNDEIPGAEPSHAIRNFRIAAGEEKGDFYGFVFQDSDVAKWLEAVAFSLAWAPDPGLEKKADEVIALLGRAQKENGYLDTYFMIRENGNEFINLWEGHELYCAGHLIEAGCAYYKVTGKRNLLEICIRMADHIIDAFHSEELKKGFPGHEEIELALVKLYEVTGDERYLDMAMEFIDRRGLEPPYFVEEKKSPRWRSIFSTREAPVRLDYCQADEPVRAQSYARGHAVRAVYLYSAMADLAAYRDDDALREACEKLYQNITKRQMYITGGIGSSGILERFTTDYDLPNDMNYSESCASIGLAMFSRRMALLTGEAHYMDTAERALMNTVLAGISMDGKRFFYVNPLAVWPKACMDGTSREHVKSTRQGWFACACCPPNIARTLASLGEYAYFTDEDSLWVNLYLSGEAAAPEEFRIRTSTSFPFGNSWKMTVSGTDGKERRVLLRIPGYVTGAALTLNGNVIRPAVEKGYACVRRAFAEGDELEITFEMKSTFMRANDEVRADAGRVALVRGPLVYCLEQADNGENLGQLVVDAQSPIEEIYDEDLLGGTMLLRCRGWRTGRGAGGDELYSSEPAKAAGTVLTFVPYPYWGNRGEGEMIVWVREALKF